MLGKVLFLSNAQQGTINQNKGVVFAEQQDMNTYWKALGGRDLRYRRRCWNLNAI